MISHEIIEDIKYRCQIEDIIGSYVNLSRGGSNYKGLCPFHSEKTPSFIVFPNSQDFHCFGCGAGGDVISFVMRIENMEYVDAIEYLAKRVGVSIPEERSYSNETVSRTKVLEMNLVAAKYFRNCLENNELGKPGRDYFQSRGLSKSTIGHFGLGYAPASFTGLYNELRSNGYNDDEIIKANLGRRSQKTNKIYDFFVGRVMFPIIDVSGNVVAFGGRVLDGSEPKYLNSSDTPAFKKSKQLFALNYARKHCSERLILCEGYMDVIALHQAGFENAVATLGTAITPDHARIFKKYSPACLISYDADSAGQKAAENAFRLLEDAGVETKIIKVHNAKDPDEFIKKFGANAFNKILDDSKSRFDFTYQNIVSKYDLMNPDQKTRAIHSICEFIANSDSSVQREIYSKKLSSMMDVSLESISDEVKHIIAAKKKNLNKQGTAELIRTTSGLADRVNPDFAKIPKFARIEETVLGLMLFRTEYIQQAIDGKLSEDDFKTSFGKKLFKCMVDEHEKHGFDFSVLNEFFTQDEVSRCSTILCYRKELSDNGQMVFDEAVQLLKKEKEIIEHNNRPDDFFSILEKKRSLEK